jgi:hypothetical protein
MEKSLLIAGRATVTDELRKGVIKEDMQAASSTALLSFMAMLLWAAYIHKAIRSANPDLATKPLRRKAAEAELHRHKSKREIVAPGSLRASSE